MNDDLVNLIFFFGSMGIMCWMLWFLTNAKKKPQ